MLLVVPRLGTISPWSSKASDIVSNCGIDAVKRVERGVVYAINTSDFKPLSDAEFRVVAAKRLHVELRLTALREVGHGAAFEDGGIACIKAGVVQEEA